MKYSIRVMIKRLLFSILLLAIGQVVIATNYYVSTSGNDSNSGINLSGPFRTIQKAASIVQAGDNVFVRGGTYREEVEMITSGSNGKPIIFTAYNNEEVIVTTTNLLGGWSLDKGSIYKTSFNSETMGREGMTLFVDGEWIQEASWSSEGAKVNMLDAEGYATLDANTPNSITDASLKVFSDNYWDGALAWVQTNGWSMRHHLIKDFDNSTGKITFSKEESFSARTNMKYIIFGTYKALDAPGEWYFNESQNILYMWAPRGDNPNESKVEIKVRDNCFNLNGTNHIQITGIDLLGGSLDMQGSSSIVLKGAHISFPDWDFGPGSNATTVASLIIDGSNNVIRDNEIEGICVKFINLMGEDNSVVNNYFHDNGYRNVYGAAIDISDCKEGNLISHNTFDQFAHSVISGTAGHQFIIQYNEFSNTCILTTDVGAIGFGNSSYGNSKIHHNVFHEMAETSSGFYMDSYTSDIVFHHNIMYNGANWGLKVNMPASNIMCFNNTIYKPGIVDGSSSTTNLDANGVRFYNNLYTALAPRLVNGGAILEGNFVRSTVQMTSNFVDASSNDYRLKSTSEAIDAGVEITNITEGFNGDAPDAGALEYGDEMWKCGHDFKSPPNPTYKWYTVHFENFVKNPSFESELNYWITTKGSPVARTVNSWNYKDNARGISGDHSLELETEDQVEQKISGLEPNTYYKLTAKARTIRDDIKIIDYSASSGTFTKEYYANEYSLTGLDNGEWTRYDNIDFGTGAPLYNKIDIGHTEAASLEIRLDNLNGALLAVVDLVPDRYGWFISGAYIPEITGVHSIFLKFNGDMGSTRLDRIRFLDTRSTERVTLGVKQFSTANNSITEEIGYAYWTGDEGVVFKTGSSSTTATVFISKLTGSLVSYVETVSLVQTEVPQSASKTGRIPGTIQCEDFDNGGQGVAYNVVNVNNVKNTYRPEEFVEMEETNDTDGNYHVNNFKAGEWLEYTIASVEAGVYDIELRYAFEESDSVPVVILNRVVLGSYDVTATGGSGVWKTMELNDVTISGGSNQVLRLSMPEGTISINYIKFVKKSSNVTIPTASFTVETSAEIGESISFTNTSTDAISYLWDFGDGTMSPAIDPVHAYNLVGSYTVELTAASSDGAAKTSKVIVISESAIEVDPPSGDITSGLYQGSNFNGWEELMPPGIYNSLLHDNDASSVKVPSGYRITLYENENLQGGKIILANDLISLSGVYFDNGAYANDNISSVLVEDLSSIASFDVDVEAVVGESILFSNTSTNASNYLWSFGDGATSTDDNPQHSYQVEGSYTVSLLASNSISESSVTIIIHVEEEVVSPPLGDPVIGLYQSSNFNGWEELLTSGTHNSLQHNNDASSVLVPSGYRVTLYENEDLQGGQIELTSDLLSLSGIYFDNGSYANDNVSSVLVEQLTVEASFSVENTVGVNEPLSFTNTSTNASGYIWSFGDGAESTEGNPSHSYSSAGSYIVELIASNTNFIDATTQVVIVEEVSVIPSDNESCALYQSSNFNGWEEVISPGIYNSLQHNNDGSSVSVPSGYKVTLYENENLQGGKIVLTEDLLSFSGIYFDNGAYANDNVSSVLVEDLNSISDLSCSIYQNSNYRGWEEQLNVGIHNVLLNNNDASSIEVISGLRVTLYENENLQGGKIVLTSDLASFSGVSFDNGTHVNDNVSSMLVEEIDAVVELAGSLYQGSNYSGWEELLVLGANNVLENNNDGSSVKVPPGFRITLYEDENLEGGKYVLTENLSSFSGVYFDNGTYANDNVSSILVEYILDLSSKSGKLSEINSVNESSNEEASILLWPVPARDYLCIGFSESNDRLISIYNMMGKQVVLVQSSGEDRAVIDVRFLEEGMYVIRIVDIMENKVITENFLKLNR